MKLRNKKTGDIWEFDEGFVMKASYETAKRAGVVSGSLTCYADSIAELNKEWEDVSPKEPLIKDPKVRKAVRAWAEANDYPKTMELYYNAPNFVLRSDISTIEFDKEIEPLQHGEEHTITELCGSEE